MLFFTFARLVKMAEPFDDASNEAQILALVQALRNGLINKQVAVITEALADHFVFVSPIGHYLKNKAEVIAYHEQIFALLPPHYSLEVKVKDITFIRPDMAIARIVGKDTFEMNGQKVKSEGSGGITAIMENGRWKIVHFGMVRMLGP